MIPFIRSLAELMAITESRNKVSHSFINEEGKRVTEDSGQRKRYLKSMHEKGIGLPKLPNNTRRNWVKGKKVFTEFLDELDYNNQIQSTYDLTLLGRQSNEDHQDAA